MYRQLLNKNETKLYIFYIFLYFSDRAYLYNSGK